MRIQTLTRLFLFGGLLGIIGPQGSFAQVAQIVCSELGSLRKGFSAEPSFKNATSVVGIYGSFPARKYYEARWTSYGDKPTLAELNRIPSDPESSLNTPTFGFNHFVFNSGSVRVSSEKVVVVTREHGPSGRSEARVVNLFDKYSPRFLGGSEDPLPSWRSVGNGYYRSTWSLEFPRIPAKRLPSLSSSTGKNKGTPVFLRRVYELDDVGTDHDDQITETIVLGIQGGTKLFTRKLNPAFVTELPGRLPRQKSILVSNLAVPRVQANRKTEVRAVVAEWIGFSDVHEAASIPQNLNSYRDNFEKITVEVSVKDKSAQSVTIHIQRHKQTQEGQTQNGREISLNLDWDVDAREWITKSRAMDLFSGELKSQANSYLRKQAIRAIVELLKNGRVSLHEEMRSSLEGSRKDSPELTLRLAHLKAALSAVLESPETIQNWSNPNSDNPLKPLSLYPKFRWLDSDSGREPSRPFITW